MVQLYKRKSNDVLVNTETLNSQTNARMSLLPGGGFVVVWGDFSVLGADTSGSGVKGQLFDANGAKVGGEFLVNATTAGSQYGPSVATLASGRFVVTWTAENQTADNGEVHGRIFEANGTPVGGEFQVNTTTFDFQFGSQVTELAGGGFLVVWTDLSEIEADGFVLLKGQRYDSVGGAVGGEFLVNSATIGGGTFSVLALANGGFAVAWNAGEAKLQLFDAAGAKVGGIQTVSAQDTGSFMAISIDALGAGFIVTWAQQDSPQFPGIPVTYDLHAQRYNASGSKIGAEILVNATHTGTQNFGDAHALPGGGFLIVWQGPADGTGDLNIYGQVFDDNGARVGDEFIVTSTTASDQTRPKIDVLASGDIVVTYTNGAGDEEEPSDIRMQILTLANDAVPTDIAISDTTIGEVAVENRPVATLSATMGALNSTAVYTIVSDETGGAFRIEGDRLVVADSSRLDFETNPSVEVRIRVTGSNGLSYEETITLTVENAVTETRYAAGDQVAVNTDVDEYNVALGSAALASGGFVVLSQWSDLGTGTGLRFQILDATGQQVGAARDLQLFVGIGGTHLSITGLASGGFVIAYEGSVDPGNAASDRPIRAQIFDAAGNGVGPDLIVSTTNNGTIYEPGVTALASGGFAVTWTFLQSDGGGGPTSSEIMARLYGADGQPVGGDFRVNTATDGDQQVSNIASLPGGGFVITWADGTALEGQRFDAAGNKVGGELTIATGLDLYDTNLAVLKNGTFVATWTVQTVDDEISIYETRAQLVGANGVNIGTPFVVATQVTAGYGAPARVAATADGGFVVTWFSLTPQSQNEEDTDSLVRFYDASGLPIGEVIQVSDGDGSYENAAIASVLASGDIAFAWTVGIQVGGNTDYDVAARIFSAATPAPAGPTPGPDTLNGTPDADTINGLGGADVLNGLGGNDFLDGGTGIDRMTGGTGDDTYIVDDFFDQVIEASGEGNDAVYAEVSYQLASGQSVETLAARNNASTAAMDLFGNAFANTIFGSNGANFLDGAGGADILTGFGGNDIYAVDNAGDVVIEDNGQGNDAIYTTFSYILGFGSSVETLASRDNSLTVAMDLFGNELANVIFGNNGANFLDGLVGADIMTGFGGNDIYAVDNAGDVVIEENGQGNDAIYTTFSYILGFGSSVELLASRDNSLTVAMNLFGNELNNTILGNNGANYLDGLTGADVMAGYSGDDTYIIDNAGDVVVEEAGRGSDAVYTSLSFVLSAGSSVETIGARDNSLTIALNITGNELGNGLLGNNGANVLDGKGGADTLLGFAGADTFAFTTAIGTGTGNVDLIADFVSGTDKVALDDAIFTGLAPGALSAGAFVTGTAAADADDRIVYDAATGKLYFDADGNGAGAAILFATLQGNPALAASDFMVI